LQSQIDAIAYPPTHTYTLNGLTPTGDLAERLHVIETEFPDFFHHGHLLDIGCNKGFFTLYHRGPVTAIDSDGVCADLTRELRPDATVLHCAFGDVMFAQTFERIFIGNGPHYMFLKAKGWDWFAQLNELASDLVLMEGPIDMSGRDAKACIPKELAAYFNPRARDGALEPFFDILHQVRSPLVDRWFTLLKKKDRLNSASGVYYTGYLIRLYQTIKTYVAPFDTIMEICCRHDRGIMGQQVIPHAAYIMVDLQKHRPGLKLDAVNQRLPDCDVCLSTAILHHTHPSDIERLLANISRSTRRKMIFSGPNAAVVPNLTGDHLYHLDAPHLIGLAHALGWKLEHSERMGLSEPLAELLLVFSR
jgi:hypothetical protein